MTSFPSLFIVSFFTFFASVSSTPPSRLQLFAQCWHEYPLFTINMQSSLDKTFEIVEYVESSDRFTSVSGRKIEPNHGPWTHPPICTGILSSIDSKLCVYTNASFSNGRGISIFTTPKLAEEFAALPAFQQVAPRADINNFSGAWTTQEIPGKGMGMLAKEQLSFGDRITAYTPALIAHLESELPTMEREKYYRIAVYQLPDATREAYMQLAYVYGQPSVRVQDIVKANTFQLQVGGQNHLAVFPETSRLNHACGPNAQYYLDPTLLTHFVHATRPIAPGEEITISYTSPIEPTESRQQHLQQGFHFSCSCPRCSAKDSTDSTLRKIQDMQHTLNDWSATSIATPKLAEKMLQLYRQEGLEGFLDIPYGFAALAYNAVGDSKKAANCATQAKEIILLKDGPWTPNLQIWVELLRDPKKHWSFKRRQR